MDVATNGYTIIETPPWDEATLREFEQLPLDPYTGSTQRFRRFSQYRLAYRSSWELELLPARQFAQP